MKTKLIFTIMAFLITTTVFSQNKPWKEQGNNANGSSQLGTINNESLRIITNDQLRMEVKADGEVIVKDSM